MRSDKYSRAMGTYTGFKGNTTLTHIEDNVRKAYPNAESELTGKQYGRVLNVAHASFLSGKQSQKIDTWAFDAPNDFLAGLPGGFVKVSPSEIIITVDGVETKYVLAI